MKPVHVLILALAVGVAAAAVWFGSNGNSAAPTVDEKLFPGLAANLDSVSRLSVSDAQGGKVTVERKDGLWVVKEKFSYPANASKLGELVVGLADARKAERKTANPELYSRLGLRDVSDSESAAILLSLTTSAGVLDVLTGNQSERFGGSTFVREPDSATSYLVAPSLVAEADVDAWIESGVFDIKADEVQSVVVTAGGVALAEIAKSAMFDSPFDLVGRTDAQTINDSAVRDLSQGLTGLEFEKVIRGVAFAINDYERVKVTYTLFSGIVIDATLFYRDAPKNDETEGPTKTEYWLNAGARFDESLAQRFVPQPDSGDDAQAATISLTTADLADRRAEVERINQTRKRWIYKISTTRFERMNKNAEALVTEN